MIKTITEEKQIHYCDICEEEKYTREKIDNKDYCSNCLRQYEEKFTKNCLHNNFRIIFDTYYSSRMRLKCDEKYCNFNIHITENEINKNKKIIELKKEHWNKKNKIKE